MWILLNYDLPVKTDIDRKEANNFRKKILKNGFVRLQYSCYIRHCLTNQNTESIIHKIRKIIIDGGKGKINIIKLTNRQCENIINFSDKKEIDKIKIPKQLELF